MKGDFKYSGLIALNIYQTGKLRKEIFLKQFPKDLEYETSRLFNAFEVAREYEIISYTDEFYAPSFWKRLTFKIENIYIFTYGVFDESDRRQVAFVPEEYFVQTGIDRENFNVVYRNLEFPCGLLKIEINSRFREYSHKDFLGSLMGLNIKRELMGDLIVENNGAAFIPVSRKVENVILNELSEVGRTPCVTGILDSKSIKEKPSYKFDEKIITVPSRRLDSIVSAITNLSRAKVIEPIEKGKILVDYLEERDKSRNIELGAVITIRGYGKFRLFSEKGETRKGKERLLVKKYI